MKRSSVWAGVAGKLMTDSLDQALVLIRPSPPAPCYALDEGDKNMQWTRRMLQKCVHNLRPSVCLRVRKWSI
jgi:hypothetical protein